MTATSTNTMLITEETNNVRRSANNLPPTPPDSEYSCEIADTSVQSRFPLPPDSSRPTQILEVDKRTPDSWVPRDARLIRLTGVHPFNVEAPLSDLYKEGFLTSQELFYVRNHGAVPQVSDEDIPDWELSVEGSERFQRQCYSHH